MTRPLTGIVDYGAGNLLSVRNALGSLGLESRLVTQPGDFEAIDRLIFPGVGAFGDCARELERRELRSAIVDWLEAGRPYLGICLGYQVLFEGSEESPGTPGLGHFAGKVQRFPEGSGLKVPHMGWNRLRLHQPEDSLWAGLPGDPYVYFVHSYFPVPEDPSLVLATSHYGDEFAAAIGRGGVQAVQFHPERSQAIGLRLLRNFCQPVSVTSEP